MKLESKAASFGSPLISCAIDSLDLHWESMAQLPILSLGLIYWPTFFLVKRKVKQLARQRGVELIRIWWFGAILRSPAYLSFWMSTEKDWERDQLDSDRSFATDINAALSKIRISI